MDNHSEQPQTSRVQRVLAGILTVIFLLTVVGFGLYGILSDPKSVLESVKFYKSKAYLADAEDTSFFPMTQARIASLENRLGKNLPLHDELSVLNASFQYAIGKDMVVEGADNMLRLENGQLYYITTCETLAEQAQDLVGLYESLDGETPFLFSYIHPGFFNGGLQLPEGYSEVDTSDELADEVIGIARSAGIETLDSRTFFEGTGLTNDDLMLKTDKHWTVLAEILAAQIYAEEINRLTGANLDLSRLQLDQFDQTVYEDLFFGTFGELVGTSNAPLEDITIYTPKYETNITRHSEHRTGVIEDESGEFAQSVLRSETLERGENGYSETAYTAYGLIEAFDELVNHGDCEEMTILVLRDSYSEPICSFLSLVASHVVSADLRYCDMTATELIEQYQPDIVIVSFSRLMFESQDYGTLSPQE